MEDAPGGEKGSRSTGTLSRSLVVVFQLLHPGDAPMETPPVVCTA